MEEKTALEKLIQGADWSDVDNPEACSWELGKEVTGMYMGVTRHPWPMLLMQLPNKDNPDVVNLIGYPLNYEIEQHLRRFIYEPGKVLLRIVPVERMSLKQGHSMLKFRIQHAGAYGFVIKENAKYKEEMAGINEDDAEIAERVRRRVKETDELPF